MTALIPNFVLDTEGTKVRPGDRIAYAVRDGNTAALRVAEVKEFVGYNDWRGDPAVEIKVGRTRIQASLKRFVKIGATS